MFVKAVFAKTKNKEEVMKRLLVSCATLVVLLFGVNSANAVFLEDWYLDIDAGGVLAPEQVNEYLDIVGPAYIQNTFTSATEFTFTEVATFRSDSHDGGVLFPFVLSDYELTGYFEGAGTGTLGGDINFTSGILDIYSDTPRNFASTDSFYGADDGTKIATFSLLSGVGTIDPSGVPNGVITVILEATDILAGYFFDSNLNDLSLIDPIQFVLGFSTTNASYVANPSANVISEFGVGANTPPLDLVVSSNGQYRLAVVPEPSTFLLLGSGLLGLGFFGYRRRNQK
jgi:hypothetical protein